MAGETGVRRALFDGAISTAFPARFQEVFVDLARDESLNFDLTGLIGIIGGSVGEASRALWHLRMIAGEQDAGDSLVVENSGTLELAALRLGEAPAVAGTSVGKLDLGVQCKVQYNPFVHIRENEKVIIIRD
ncbi:hypothetical protein HU200_032132 [Digitaria exilis]|uniref:Uncharacterized protein n=1 Tax=Digitaria exilis TaxID=1010633 RepID=A0A835EPH3_9POAL|nr:hypothetical protein HU200_032132 [Digitaria exilis]